MPTWINNDGLAIYYGQTEAEVGNGGEYKTFDLQRVIDVEVDLADLTEAETVISKIVFPFGKVLGKVEIIADVAAATGVAIDIGFVEKGDGSTVAAQGAVAALPVASLNVEGETTVLTAGVTYAGTLVGQVVHATEPLLITASRTTATAFTAGRIRIRLHWYKKSPTT